MRLILQYNDYQAVSFSVSCIIFPFSEGEVEAIYWQTYNSLLEINKYFSLTEKYLESKILRWPPILPISSSDNKKIHQVLFFIPDLGYLRVNIQISKSSRQRKKNIIISRTWQFISSAYTLKILHNFREISSLPSLIQQQFTEPQKPHFGELFHFGQAL